jgi:hypothetical protein
MPSIRRVGALAQAVLVLVASALGPLAAIPAHATPVNQIEALGEAPRYTSSMPPIGVSVLRDGLDLRGNWTQVLRLTIKSGGSLADASLVVFGDFDHVDAIFAAAKKQNPHILAPTTIPVNQTIDLPIDPSTTFALSTILHRPNALVQHFTNGVIDTIYDKPEGILTRVITFPDGKPTEQFTYPGVKGAVHPRPGGKVVDVAYAPGSSFGDVVRQIYGITTYAAATDLTKQTGWSAGNFPPAPGDEHEIVVGPPATYTAMPPEAQPIPNPDPAGRARQQQLQSDRSRVGITAIRLESFNQVYRVAVNNPELKASDVSRLLYGTDTHRVDIARAAGFDSPGLAGLDPHLFGRAFDVIVDYVDEAFVVQQSVSDTGVVEVRLADGASITSYPAGTTGPMRVVKYPTGYKRVLYRPAGILLTIANGLALFHAANNLTLASSSTEPLSRRYAAEVIWRWGPAVPRQSGDLTESIDLVDDPGGAYINALVAPPLPRSDLQTLIDALDPGNPFRAIVALVVVATVVVVVADGLRRFGRGRRRLRW